MSLGLCWLFYTISVAWSKHAGQLAVNCCLSWEVMSSIPGRPLHWFLCGFIHISLCQSISIKPRHIYICMYMVTAVIIVLLSTNNKVNYAFLKRSACQWCHSTYCSPEVIENGHGNSVKVQGILNVNKEINALIDILIYSFYHFLMIYNFENGIIPFILTIIRWVCYNKQAATNYIWKYKHS